MAQKQSYLEQAHQYYREQQRRRRIMAARVPRGLVIKAGALVALGGGSALSQILAACVGAPRETTTGTSASYEYSKYALVDKYHFRRLPWPSTPYVDGVHARSGSGATNWDLVRLVQTSYGMIWDTLLYKKYGAGVNLYKHEVVGHIADRWKPAPDYSYTDYHIRTGVYFHDIPPVNGRLCTAEDVKYCYDVYRTQGSNQAPLEPIDRIEVLPDKETVRVHLKRPVLFTDHLFTANDYFIFAREHFEGSRERWQQQPIGTGPLKMVQQEVGQSMLLQREERFARTDDRWPGYRLPFLRETRYIAVTSGAPQAAAFRSGQIDGVQLSDSVELDDYLATKPESIVQVIPGNSNYPPNPWILQHRDPLFQDVRVRRALSLGINRRQMIDTLTGGNGAGGYLVSWDWQDLEDPFAPEDLGPWQRYDPAKARQLLAEAGYPNGFEMEYLVSGVPGNRDIMAQQMLGEIGVRVTFNQVESVVLTSSRLEKSFKHAISGTSSTGYDPVKVIRDFMLPNSPKNYGNISDPVMTDLVERVTYTTDFDERGRLLQQIHERYLDQVYSIDFYSNTYMFVRQPWLHNVAYAVEGYFLAFGSSQLAHAWIDDKAPSDRAGRLKA